VAAGPDGRTFYAIYANYGRVPGDLWIYRFRITASGTATGPAAINGGTIAGQDNLGNVGGFVVSPDGTRLAVAVASVHDGSSQSTVASEILVVDLRTGARSTWRGGMERDGQTFGIEDLSWTGNGESLAYWARGARRTASPTASMATSSARAWEVATSHLRPKAATWSGRSTSRPAAGR
jgi:hypothetical protein